MLWHVILGLLRDDKPRHGYELAREYRVRSGVEVASGNFYRELARLVDRGFTRPTEKPPDVDERRIPYLITLRGRQVFDRWLVSPAKQEADLTAWLLFVDRLPAEVREKLLDRRIDDLWIRGKALSRELDEAMEAAEAAGDRDHYNTLPALISRRIKLNTVEIEFIKQFREDFNAWHGQRGLRPADVISPVEPTELARGTARGGDAYEAAARAGAPPVDPEMADRSAGVARDRSVRDRSGRARGARK